MKCFFCKDTMARGTTTHVVELDERVIIVRNVPCFKCPQCGEAVLQGSVIGELEKLVSTLCNITDVAIINYPDRVA